MKLASETMTANLLTYLAKPHDHDERREHEQNVNEANREQWAQILHETRWGK